MKDFDTFTKVAKNVDDLGKIILANGFEKLPNLVTLFPPHDARLRPIVLRERKFIFPSAFANLFEIDESHT